MAIRAEQWTLWVKGGAIGCAVAAAGLLGALDDISRWGYDQLFAARGTLRPQTPIVIVSVGEDSFDELDQTWPWPRAVHAKFLDIVEQGAPAVVGFDIQFSEPSPFGAADDETLGAAIAKAGNVVLASGLTIVRGEQFLKEDLNAPVPAVRRGALGFGPAQYPTDSDAVIRWATLGRKHQGKEWPGFALLLFKAAGEAGVIAAGEAAAVRPDTTFLINYRGAPATFQTVPYYRVLNGEVPPTSFRGKIVLIGATSPVLHDLFATPLARSGEMPGVEIHAAVLETLSRGDRITQVPGGALAGLAIVAALIAVGIAVKFRPMVGTFLIAMAVLLCIAISIGAFLAGHVWFDAVPPTIAVSFGYGMTVLGNYIREQREKRRLSQFFSPSVLDEVIRHQDDQALGTARREITVLFSDIRGFTTMSEKLQPEQVAELLKDYLTELTEVVFRHGGTVDKYVGDCIMALYNAPLASPDHAAQAVRTALEFQTRTESLSKKWEAKVGVQIRNGVGINTGEAVVGTLGSRQRLEYTAIGDTVNLAARLEGITKDFQTPIIMSESTHRLIEGQFMTRCLGEVKVKGKDIPVKIYSVGLENLRQHERVTIVGRVTVVDGDLLIDAAIVDLSVTGLAVSGLPKLLKSEDLHELRVHVGRAGAPAVVMGRVAWATDDRAGFAFVPMVPDGRAQIQDYLTRREEPPSPPPPADWAEQRVQIKRPSREQ